MTSLCAFVQIGPTSISLSRVSAESMVGITTGMIVGIASGVITEVAVGVTTRITKGVAIVFRGISGEKTLLLLVILLAPTMLSMSGSVSSAVLFF